jgi:hypothetical protein
MEQFPIFFHLVQPQCRTSTSTTMATLTSLPPELKGCVLDHLSFADTNNLSKTCKSLRAVAYPALFRNIQVGTRFGGSVLSHVSQLLSLIRTLITNRGLARRVKTVKFHNAFKSYDISEYRQDERTMMQHAIECSQEGRNLIENTSRPPHLPFIVSFEKLPLESSDNENTWSFEIPRVPIMLLLCQCYLLEHLTIPLGLLKHYIRVRIQPQTPPFIGQAKDELNMLDNLSSLIVRSNGSESKPIKRNELEETFHLILSLPKLKFLELECMPELTEAPEKRLSDSLPPNEQSIAKELKTLRIVYQGVPSSTLSIILRHAPYIQTLYYHIVKNYHSGDRLDLGSLRIELQLARSILKHLSINYMQYGKKEKVVPYSVPEGDVSLFHDFTELVTLECTLEFLFGQTDMSIDRPCSLADFFPPHLEQLTIQASPWKSDELVRSTELALTMVVFREFFAGEKMLDNWTPDVKVQDIYWTKVSEGSWKSAVSNLKGFTFDCTGSRHFWRKPGSIPEGPLGHLQLMCESQGIRCQILPLYH